MRVNIFDYYDNGLEISCTDQLSTTHVRLLVYVRKRTYTEGKLQVCALVKLFFYMYLFLDLFLSMARRSHSAVATKKAQKAQKLQSPSHEVKAAEG